MKSKVHKRPRVAVFKFASCDGCQLSLLDCEDELLVVAGAIEVGNADIGLDAARTSGEHDHARSEIDRLIDVVGHEQRRLARAPPDRL